jgi:hypothetical protein
LEWRQIILPSHHQIQPPDSILIFAETWESDLCPPTLKKKRKRPLSLPFTGREVRTADWPLALGIHSGNRTASFTSIHGWQ